MTHPELELSTPKKGEDKLPDDISKEGNVQPHLPLSTALAVLFNRCDAPCQFGNMCAQ